ncbi:MAG: hypothetical protein GY953_27985, partial [bacterium]|nr:hypothetical protein [bacterium]
IVIRNKRDVVQEVPKDQVRKVTAKRGKVRYAPLIGAAGGALTMTYLTTRRGSDFTGEGVAIYAGIGAAIGAGIGGLVRKLGGWATIYRAPRR